MRHAAVRRNLGETVDFSQIETPSRADAEGVTPVRPLPRTPIELDERYGRVQQRRANSVVGSLEVVHRPRIAKILCADVPAVECRARRSLQIARVHRGTGTCQRCALEPTPRSRSAIPTHHCRVSHLGRALRQLAATDLVDRRGEDAARRCSSSATSSCCRKPRRGLRRASRICCARSPPRCCRGRGWPPWRWSVGLRDARVDQQGRPADGPGWSHHWGHT